MNYLPELQQAAECLHLNDLPRAEQLYKQVLSLDPTNGHAYLGMGKIALQVEQYDKAVSILTKSCELLPQEISPLLLLSDSFNWVFSEKDALTVLEYAAKQFPCQPLVHYQLGLQYLILGELDKAESSFQTVLPLSQGKLGSFAMFELSRLGQHSVELNHLISKRLKHSQLTSEEQIVLHYALGNLLDSKNEFQHAWSHYEQANVLQQQSCQFKTQELGPFFEQIKVHATRSNMQRRIGQPKKDAAMNITPIFILGLPRTGSSLLEFLLTQNPDIASAGEVGYLGKEVDEHFYRTSGVRFPESLKALTEAQMQQGADLYLHKLARHANGKPYVIDKLPANFQSIGLIYKLFPHAKILHIQRNLAAVACSIFRNNFAQNEPYFCSLTGFKHYHELYSDLMAHWKTVCADFIYDVSYEQLIQDKTSTIEKILSHCGIGFPSTKFVQSQNPQVIKTLSNIQVNRAISANSMDQWHNYAEYLSMFNDNKKIKHAIHD